MDSAEEKVMEGDRGGVRVGAPTHPSVRLLWDVRAADAVLEILRTTRAGCIGAGRVPPEDRGRSARERREG